MKKRYMEDRIVGILKDAEACIRVAELCRKYGIGDATCYNWKASIGGMTFSDVRRLRLLEGENRRLKELAGQRCRFGYRRLHITSETGRFGG